MACFLHPEVRAPLLSEQSLHALQMGLFILLAGIVVAQTAVPDGNRLGAGGSICVHPGGDVLC